MIDNWNDPEIRLRIEKALFESVCRHNADAVVFKHNYFKNDRWFDPEVDPGQYNELIEARDEAKELLRIVRGY